MCTIFTGKFQSPVILWLNDSPSFLIRRRKCTNDIWLLDGADSCFSKIGLLEYQIICLLIKMLYFRHFWKDNGGFCGALPSFFVCSFKNHSEMAPKSKVHLGIWNNIDFSKLCLFKFILLSMNWSLKISKKALNIELFWQDPYDWIFLMIISIAL